MFDELTSSGRIVVIEDLDVRRRVLELYAQIEVNLRRLANARDEIDSRLYSVIAGHLPPGLVRRDLPTIWLDEGVSPQEMRNIALSIGSEESLLSAIRAEIQERETQRAFLAVYQDRLEAGRDELKAHLR